MENREVYVGMKTKFETMVFMIETNKSISDIRNFYETYWAITVTNDWKDMKDSLEAMTWMFIEWDITRVIANSDNIKVRIYVDFEDAKEDTIFWERFRWMDTDEDEWLDSDTLETYDKLLETMRNCWKFTRKDISKMKDFKHKLKNEKDIGKRQKLMKESIVSIMTAMVSNDMI